MKKLFTLLTFCALVSLTYAESNVFNESDPLLKRFVTNNKVKADENYQSQLRSLPVWKNFMNQHGEWWVQFNETNQKPHRAFGTPIALNLTGTPQAAAAYFINNYLQAYVPSSISLEFTGATETKKYIQPNFIQRYNGLEVLWSRVTVKMTPNFNVVMFGADVYDNINISTSPALSAQDAITFASADINTATNVVKAPVLKVLPVPGNRNNDFRLVYEVTIGTKSMENMPSKYYTLLDANTGEILYRDNLVESFGSSDVTVQGTVYPKNNYQPTAVVSLPYVQIAHSATTVNADANGQASLNLSGPTNVTFTLAGPWAAVYTNATGASPAFTTSIADGGAVPVSFDGATTIRHISGYYHTNKVHDFMQTQLPGFTAMDYQLDVNIDMVGGNCNAFYDGPSINFWALGNNCNCLSTVADVVYHEYGHGINDKYWTAHGSSFDNGAMGEAYSDVWAMSITNDPVLGVGFSSVDPNTFIRNYDFANGVKRKVYPDNLTGEVHADGEIIAGAWWSTGLQFANVAQMTSLFAESLAGLSTGPNGTEGQVYHDILVDALFADDNDGNLQNGTPNLAAITTAFALHGISLISNATLNHTPVEFVNAGSPVTIDASLTNLTTFAWAFQSVGGAYRINNSTTWTPLSMTNVGGNNYSVTLPGQPNGTVIAYYLNLTDIFGNATNVTPQGANAADPNLPNFIMVGFDLFSTDDFDFNAGNWTQGVASDDAITGMWELDMPSQVLINGAVGQPGTQHTIGGFACYVTGAAEFSAGTNNNDVDDGKTTLISPVYDFTTYANPAIEYFRWYSNDQGATPGTDFWQVAVSNDNVNWVPVENTVVADHSWRRFVFRVADYVSLTNTVSVRFIAEDAADGSLIEGLLDDFSVYDQKPVGLPEHDDFTSLSASPNPAYDKLKVNVLLTKSGSYNFSVVNNLGQKVYSNTQKLTSGNQNFDLPVNSLSNGMYQLLIQGPSQQKALKFSVNH